MISIAREKVMLRSLLAIAREFYADPENVKAFEIWKKKREAEGHAETKD